MAIKKTIQIWNPILAKKAKTIKDIHAPDTKKLIKDLIDSMRANNLVGMAAPQIWISKRIFITEIRETKFRKAKDADTLKIFINPTITWRSQKSWVMYEWCWSVAYSKIFAPVKRSSTIIIEAYNEHREKNCLKIDGLLARVIQHEYDHLDGVCFTEHITDMKKIMSDEEYIKRIVNKK